MKKKQYLLILAVLLAAMLLTGCGAKSSASASAPAMEIEASTPAADAFFDMESRDSSEGARQNNPVYQDPDAKLIREADVRIQSTEFEQAVSELEELVVQMGGYFQSASLDGGSYRNVNANRSGEYVIRIPAENYELFLGQTGDLGYVTYRSETTQNIGEQYYDTEARLKTQKTKQERLLSLLAKAETMEDIITLESALSDVEYEIEQLSSTLNRYDSLVGFSTIRRYLDEVHKVTEGTGVADSLGQRMAKGFSSSLAGLVEGFENTLVWASYHVFGLLVFGGLAVCGIVIGMRKFGKLKKKTKSLEPGEEKRAQ